MASYHLSLHPNVSRGKGQSLVRTAAYNGRTLLVDERTGEEWDYRHLGGVLFSGMYAPKDAPDWARDLGQLVNEVEQFEKRSDSQLAMNLDIALPHEQTLEQNRRLLQDLVREQFVRQGYAAHVAIHEPDQDGDDRNIHAHVLVTLRKIEPDGFAPTKSEQQDRYRNRGEYTENLRDAWEKLANRHLERNGYDARIDRRSLQEQGIEREPQQHRGPTLTKMEREGRVTNIGEKIRQRQEQHAELRALDAEEKKIEAEIIDLAAERAKRAAPAAAREQFEGRSDAMHSREAELPPDIARVFAIGAANTNEPPRAASAIEQPAIAADNFYLSAEDEAAPQMPATTGGVEQAGGTLGGRSREMPGPQPAELKSVDVTSNVDDSGLSRLFGGIAKFARMVLSLLDGTGGAQLTKQQRHDQAQAPGKETPHASEATPADEAAKDRPISQADQEKKELDAEFYSVVREVNQQRERDGGRERERERER